MVQSHKGPKGSKDNEPTPQWFYCELQQIFNFDFDPCIPNYKEDSLKIKWGKRNYVNCPWSNKKIWIHKVLEEQKLGNLSVMWLPVGTDTKWFKELILPNASVYFIPGRVNLDNGKHPAYPSMLCIFFPKLGY